MGLGGIFVHQEQHVSPWSFREILAKQQASSTGGHAAKTGRLDSVPHLVSMGSAHLESTQTSPASHTQALQAPPCPHSERPSPPRYHLAVLGAGSSAQAWQGWHRKGSDPTPPSSLPSSCRSPSKPTIWQVRPTPTPVWSSRHGLSFHRSSAFPGVWSSPASREVGVFTSHGSKCCWLQHPLSSHGFWQGTVTATTGPWQILAGEGGWPIVCFYSSPVAL